MTVETRPFDSAAYLDSPESMLAYLEGAFADGDSGEIADALGVVARARGMPEFATVMKVIRALGFCLHPEPASAA